MTTIQKNSRKIMASVLAGVCALVAIGITSYSAKSGTLGFERFDPKTYKGKMGKVTLPYHGNAVLTTFSNSGRKISEYSTTNGVLLLPVGNHDVWGCDAIAKDKNNVSWTASISPGNTLKIDISANKAQKLNFGPPFIASIKVTKHGNKADLDLNVVTAQGNNKCVIKKSDGETDPPRFKVINSTGKVVWSGSFKYG
ncbi:MAG: hypothetical protein ABFD64_06845 [Armatimonadota bacterium]